MSDEETYEIPLQDQRVFGAGIKRSRVRFVPSSSSLSSSSTTQPTSTASSAKSVSDRYLSLVLPKEASLLSTSDSQVAETVGSRSGELEQSLCEICQLPLLTETETTSTADNINFESPQPPLRPHEASLAHQVCLTHSHPPSHLDRTRKGLSILSTYGWDPDSRLGLGAQGQGIQFPIKTKQKDDKLGIGVVLPKEGERKVVKVKKLDAGKVRKMVERDRRRGERLREIFYRDEDVERYLGGG